MKRNRGSLLFAFLLLAALACGSFASGAAAREKQNSNKSLKSEAKISMKEARAKALERVPGGRVKAGELEREKGRLIYSFDIRPAKGSGIDEVQVDAITGEIVSVDHETPAKEATEKRQETKHKKH
ncbi:MAG: PepSY domain-containing protein [Acidobacteria bacterium]|nr:PepSY domain-containing protein [Acidobacteriota bacterium]